MSLLASPFCPACERSRDHVPARAACPYCTCPPHAEVQFIRQSRPGLNLLALLGVLLCVAAVPGRDVGRWTPAALFGLGACTLLARVFIAGPARRAVLWAEGGVLLDAHDAPRPLDWQRTRAVTLDAGSRSVICTPSAGGDIVEIPIAFFGTARRAADFVAQAGRRVTAAQSGQVTSGPSPSGPRDGA